MFQLYKKRPYALWHLLLSVTLISTISPTFSHGQSFVINPPGGDPVVINISHAGPSGSLVTPQASEPPQFRPPSIFSAPLPSGSGARALGLAGAFTAVADDATAASWNPGGLTQLERPEASFVFRASYEKNIHSSGDDDYDVGDNSFDSQNLNYFSLAYPFRILNRNIVCSLNYQEAYDFTTEFSAKAREGSSGISVQEKTETFNDVQVDEIDDGFVEMTVTTYVTTKKTSVLRQLLDSGMVNDLDFKQEGIIDAATPAFAIGLTPKVSVGAAVNFYQDSPLFDHNIRSRTHATFSGNTASTIDTLNREYTEGTYDYDGVADFGGGMIIPFSGSGTFEPFSNTGLQSQYDRLYTEGTYEEVNEFDDLRGINATFGMLWTVSRHLSLGATLDLPWTADAEQTRTITQTTTTYKEDQTTVVDQSETRTVQKKDVEFDFPWYSALGAVWRWNNRLYSTLDISHTHWSDFSFKAEGETRINPLDGSSDDSPGGRNEIDDCWAVRFGTEYLWVLNRTEIPFRGGLAWEQRPAVNDPDNYYSASLGSGISIGKDPGRTIIDFAYIFTYGDDVMGSLVPDRDLTTDSVEHQFYLSCIQHF